MCVIIVLIASQQSSDNNTVAVALRQLVMNRMMCLSWTKAFPQELCALESNRGMKDVFCGEVPINRFL